MPQGFVIDLNLSESSTGDSDANILNNLGIAPVADDIRLFAGNLRDTSVIPASAYSISGTDFIINTEGFIPPSNRTVVEFDGTSYIVSNSNAIDEFKLKDAAGNFFSPAEKKDIVRSNAIFFENFENLNARRLETNQSAETIDDDDFQSFGQEDDNLFEERTITQNLSIAQETVNNFYYKESRIPVSYKDNIFDKQLSINGNVRITNTAQVPRSDTSPGVFIISGGNVVRSFSDTSNSWSEITIGANNFLETTSNNSIVQTLTLNEPNLEGISTAIESGTVITDFTHKLKVEINGEVYYLLLTT